MRWLRWGCYWTIHLILHLLFFVPQGDCKACQRFSNRARAGKSPRQAPRSQRRKRRSKSRRERKEEREEEEHEEEKAGTA